MKEKKPDPTNLGLPRNFEYTEEMLEDDLKAIDMFRNSEREKKNYSERYIDDIKKLSDKQLEKIKESIRKGEKEDELLWFWDLDRGVYNKIKKMVRSEEIGKTDD